MTSYSPEELDFLHAVFNAAREGDTNSLSPLLAEGLTPDLTNDRGDTLLILAAYHQHVDAVQLLLDHGADHSRVNDQGQTALGAAVFRRATAIVSALLRAGANPERRLTHRAGVRGVLQVGRHGRDAARSGWSAG